MTTGIALNQKIMKKIKAESSREQNLCDGSAGKFLAIYRLE